MSIHTNANPETSKIREQSNLRPADMTPTKKSQDPVELEISLPMLIVLILAIGVVIYAGYSFFFKKDGATVVKNPPATIEEGQVDVTVSLDYLTIRGDEKAKYMFVEISDFECPYCQLFSNGAGDGKPSTFSQIESQYINTGIMKFGYAPYTPFAGHEPAATSEVIGFYCAKAQNKAFEYHKAVFAKTAGNGLGIDGKGAEKASLVTLAEDLGMNESEFAFCYDKRDIVTISKVQEKIKKEIRTPWGDKFGDKNFGTPAFAVCKLSADNPTTCVGKAYVGAGPYAEMKQIIDTFLGADAPK
jgi:protein-disulfide isomerase